jgi:hypothetical protein
VLGTLSRWGAIAAIVGGTIWVVKFAVITARDDGFEPLEGLFYFAGLIGIVLGSLGLAAFVAARQRGWLRTVTFVVVLVVAFGLSILLGDTVQSAIESDNQGIDEEPGILAVAVLWLGIGIALSRRTPPARG